MATKKKHLLQAQHKRYEAKHRLEIKERKRLYWLKNKEKLSLVHKLWKENNPEKYSELQRRGMKLFTSRHPEKVKADHKAWRTRNRDYINACRRKKWNENLDFKIGSNLRKRVWDALNLKKNIRSSRTLDMLGCSIESFKLYLESKFEVGMSWENYGKTGWHIDHIMPCAIFDLTNPEHQKRCFHFSNMQPMWAAENYKKGKKHIVSGDVVI